MTEVRTTEARADHLGQQAHRAKSKPLDAGSLLRGGFLDSAASHAGQSEGPGVASPAMLLTWSRSTIQPRQLGEWHRQGMAAAADQL